MPVKWFFTLDDSGVVDVVARAEGGDAIGDMRDTIKPGQSISWPPGLSYDDLKAAGGGVVVISDDDSFEINPPEAEAPPPSLETDDTRSMNDILADLSKVAASGVS